MGKLLNAVEAIASVIVGCVVLICGVFAVLNAWDSLRLRGTHYRRKRRLARLPKRRQQSPIRAWKYAYPSRGQMFMPMTWTRDYGYGVDAMAVCRVGGEHEQIPDLDCSCGFYASKEIRDLDYGDHDSAVLLEVELHGRVIACDRGYRAQRQRVKRILLAPDQERQEATLVAAYPTVAVEVLPQIPDHVEV